MFFFRPRIVRRGRARLELLFTPIVSPAIPVRRTPHFFLDNPSPFFFPHPMETVYYFKGPIMPASKHKVILLGETAVGKTSIVNQFVYGTITENYQPTIGMDFFTKTVLHEDQEVRLQIWDTAGQERFHAIGAAYIRSATVAIFVYDITAQSSFDEIKKSRQQALEIANPVCVVVGNKVDLEKSRVVSSAEGKEYAESISAQFFETSAQTGVNIRELFEAVAGIPVPEGQEGEPNVEQVDLGKVTAPKQSGGCFC
jgi:Ras-related protein Rab-6A